MEFFTTKIVDQLVDSKINLEEINSLLASLELPDVFNGIEKIIVTIVVREPNDFEFDSWKGERKIYFTIPLVYNEILDMDEVGISKKCIENFKEYMKELKLD